MFKKIAKKIFNLAIYYIKRRTSNYSNSKLGSLLRARIHLAEKMISDEEADFLNIIYARMLYFEARKRNLLSNDEISWCSKILFGISPQHDKKFLDKNKNINNLLENIIQQRRSIRKWKDIKLKEEEFERLVNAARWAPSSCNRQPWCFLLTQDKNKIKFLSEIRKQSFIKNAPSCILILIDTEAYDEITKYYFTYLDAGVAIQNMLLMAENMNLGACFINFAPTSNFELQKKQINKKFKIPLNFEIIGMLPIGRTDEKPSPPGRKSISDISYFETF